MWYVIVKVVPYSNAELYGGVLQGKVESKCQHGDWKRKACWSAIQRCRSRALESFVGRRSWSGHLSKKMCRGPRTCRQGLSRVARLFLFLCTVLLPTIPRWSNFSSCYIVRNCGREHYDTDPSYAYLFRKFSYLIISYLKMTSIYPQNSGLSHLPPRYFDPSEPSLHMIRNAPSKTRRQECFSGMSAFTERISLSIEWAATKEETIR